MQSNEYICHYGDTNASIYGDHSIPTRAEVTDVFQAVLDGTNAVMLSAESASGEHPIESVKTLRRVSEFAEHVKKTVLLR